MDALWPPLSPIGQCATHGPRRTVDVRRAVSARRHTRRGLLCSRVVTPGRVRLGELKLRLTPTAAAGLNSALHTHAFSSAVTFATLSIDARVS